MERHHLRHDLFRLCKGGPNLDPTGIPFKEQTRTIDKEGRYAVLEGLLEGHSILIGSIYAPNIEQAQFWTRLTSTLTHHTLAPWILGGDNNCALDTNLDRSHSPPRHSPAHRQTAFNTWVTQWALTDVWRARNSNTKLYSFHSIPHNL